jgi:hypothetical protein
MRVKAELIALTGAARRQSVVKNQLANYGITFGGSKSRTTMNIPRNINEKIACIARWSTGSDSSKDCKVRSQSNQKKEYSKRQVRRVYISSGLSRIESEITSIFNDDTLNLECRRQIFLIFLAKVNDLARQFDIEWRTEVDHINAAIVESIKQFMAGTHSDGCRTKSHQKASNIILSAVMYRCNVSQRRLAKTLNVNRVLLQVTNKIVDNSCSNIVLNNNIQEEENDDIDYRVLSPQGDRENILNFIIFEDDVSDADGCDSDVDYNNEEILDSDSDNDSVEHNRACVASLIDTCNPTRSTRNDAVNVDTAIDYWHACTQYNTNSSKNHPVLSKDGSTYESHRERLQTDSTIKLYNRFIASQAYLDQVQMNSKSTVGLTRFSQARCKCIK